MTFSVKECLRGYTNDALDILCREWTLVASSKDSRIRALDKVLHDPLHLKGAVAGLGPEERRALHLINRRGSTRYTDLVSVPGLIGDGRTPDAIEKLARRGFVLVSPIDRAGSFTFKDLALNGHAPDSGPVLVVPEAVSRILPEPPAIEITLEPVDSDFATKPSASQGSMTWTALEALRAVDLVAPRLTGTGDLHRSDWLRLTALAKEAAVSAESLELALMMLRATGTIAALGGRLVTTRLAADWVQAPHATRMRMLFEAFLASESLPDVRLFFPELFEAFNEHLPEGSLRRVYHRRLTADVLRTLPAGVWHRVDDLAATVRRADPNVLFVNERWRALKSNAGEGTTVWRQLSWQSHEARFFAWFVRTLLYKLDMAEVSEDESHFRLTPAGAYALGSASAPELASEEADSAVVVQADFEIVAYGDRCSPWVRRTLDLFAERVRFGAVSTYRLTPESVYKGVQSGISTDEFMALLERHGAHGVPANVRAQFASWLRKLENVTVRRHCTLVEFRDSTSAEAFLASNTIARRVGDRFVQVADADSSNVLNYDEPLPPCLAEGKDLTLRADWNRINLFVRRRLEDVGVVTELPNGDLSLELRPDRVDPDNDWSLVFAQLEALALGPLSGRYRTALRAWSGDIGPALTRTATLLRFDEPDVCDTAMAIEEIAEHVEGRLGLQTLLVKAGKLNALKKAITRHGVRVTRSDAPFDDGPPSTWAHSGEDDEPVPVEPELRRERRKRVPTPAPDTSDSLPSYAPRIIREILEDAIQRRRPVMIRYQSTWSDHATVRRVNPVTVDLNGASPKLNAYCHQHGASRAFKLSRIAGIRVLEEDTF